MQSYTEHFYKDQQERTRQSAKEIIPLVLELVQPKQVIDVGCGTGTWLSVFKDFGVDDVFGIDGDWVDKKMLLIPEHQFTSVDLNKPFRKDKQFDLVVSLEVAEHLPSECADAFVDSLVRLGPVILFSAAIPFQGGTHHINEQWQDYWAKLFRQRGYVAIDCIRNKIWHNDNVQPYYAQNILMYARSDYLENHPLIKAKFEHTKSFQLSIVHLTSYLRKCSALNKSLAVSELDNMSPKKLLSVLPI